MFTESVTLAFLEQVEPVCTAFEDAWCRGERPDVAYYVDQWHGKERAWLLRQLLRVELESRRAALEQFHRDEYYQRFPHDRPLVDLAFSEATEDLPTTQTFMSGACVSNGVLRLCQEFAQACRANPPPGIESYLARCDLEHRRALLYELLLCELEMLDEQGTVPSASDYVSRFPAEADLVEHTFQEYFHARVALEVIIGPHKGRAFTFTSHDSFIVGRARDAHFRLPVKDPYFSRVHFLVEVNPPHCELVDLCSLNGTKVNGQTVESARLRHGDLVQGGDTVMMVSLDGFTDVAGDSLSVDVERATDSAANDVLTSIAGYDILRPLGRGGMGVVYLARRPSDGVEVALKRIQPAITVNDREIQRFLREAQILCALRHPNIVTFHQLGRDGENFYIVMDYVPGQDAATLLKQHGALPVGRAVGLMCQVLDALEFAHSQGFVHRDVKPANLLVTHTSGNDVCRLADFGLARVYHESRMSGITMLGNVGGTIPYMAPEQITNFRDAQPPADQYAAAATLYHLLTGHYVHDVKQGRHNQRLMNILTKEPIPIASRRPDIPPSLAEAIHKALVREPTHRFASVRDFRDALSPFRSEA